MKGIRTPVIVIGVLYLVFFASVALSLPSFPSRVATHFNISGNPDGWMSRQGYAAFTVAFGLLFPLLVPLLTFLARYVPDDCQNIPNREYWFAPNRRPETFNWFVRHSLWFAVFALCFAMAMHFSIWHANRSDPPHLSGPLVWPLLGLFLASVLVWSVTLFVHFNRVPKE